MPRNKKPDSATYTKPALRARIKEKVLAGNKAGEPGQWSARKAQMVAREYEEEGGGYKKPRNEAQRNLQNWDKEKATKASKKTGIARKKSR